MTTATATGDATLGADGAGVSRERTLSGTPSSPGAFTGWFDLLRLLLRRDRVRLVIWVVAVAAMVLVSALSMKGVYDTVESLQNYASLVEGNAAVVVQAGPGYGLDDPTLGSVLMNETSIWTIILVSLMSIFLVTRHTRAEEETERAELLRSTPLGRHAAGAATMVGALIANAAAGAMVAVGLIAYGFDATGSIAFGCALVGAGMVFAGITLVTAQIASTGRAATGMALTVLGISFVLRAVGDVSENGLSWLSPIGWGQSIRAFADERWWVLLVPATATVALTAGASALAARRDFGAGMTADRPGRPAATRWLSSSLGLAGRLQRGALLGWSFGVLVLGAFYGVIASEVEQMLADTPELEEFFAQAGGGSIIDSFLASAAMMMSLLAAGFAVSSVLRLNGEETQGRVDVLLATPTPRTRWASSHLIVALLGTFVVLAAGGLGVGAGAAVALDDPSRVIEMLGATLAFLPAIAVLGGAAFALWGVAGRLGMLAWVGVAWVVVVGLLAAVLDLPNWSRGLSPLYHVPALPAVELDVVPLVALTAVAALLLAVGLVGLRRRDIGTN